MANAAAAAASERAPVLRMEREFKAPPERVFAAFTDPRLFAQWWGPEGMHCPVCEIDLRVGGKWRACMRGAMGEHSVSGVYREISPPRRLAFTWAWEENGVRGHETIVEIEFVPAGRNTKLVLNHRGFETADLRDRHTFGWTSSFVCLDQFLQGG
jgi:glutathione S-transferase